MVRTAKIARQTKETDITLELTLDGTGQSAIGTGVGFFDHMLTHLAKHSLMDLAITAKGDTHIDDHHTVEDISLVLGAALDKALGDKGGIFRYGWASIPMDDTLATVALDLSGRPAFVFNVTFPSKKIDHGRDTMRFMRTTIVLLCIALVLTALPVAAEPLAQGCEGLVNAGFEDGFSERGAGEVTVANGWNPWWQDGPFQQDGFYRRPEFKQEDIFRFGNRRIHSGNNAAKFFTTFSTHNAGFWQQVSVPVGSNCTFSIDL